MTRRGFTLVEIVTVITVTGILAAAVAVTIVPQMNTFFYFPQNMRVGSAAADALDIMLEGDIRAKGLRYTGPPCEIGGAGGGGSTITAASATSLTYHYVDADSCGTGAARLSHTVVLAYDSTDHVITRAIDGGSAENIPSYVPDDSDINFDPPSGVSFFRYFNNEGSEMTGLGITTTAIYRVDITMIAASGSGQVQHNAGRSALKTGVEIKRYADPPTACGGSGAACTAHSQCCAGLCA
jgi:prepilin-type N-terminal cleavage/methylation domain-containing protein